MLLGFPTRVHKLWVFREVVSVGGRGLITDWYDKIPPTVRAVFDDRLSFLGINERANWQYPEFRALTGAEGKAGLSEIRWKSQGIQWRVIGFFGPGKMEYAMLIGCNHKQGRYTPPDSLTTAVRRKTQVESQERTTRVYQYE
jgi:hypothetical protein